MKTFSPINLVLLLLSNLLLFCGCNEDNLGEMEVNRWVNQLDESDRSFTKLSMSMRLYYLKEDGSGWIDPENIETYPVTHFEETNDPIKLVGEIKPYDDIWFYNNGSISYDKEEQLYYYSSHVFLDGTSEYSFPIYWNGRVDRMKVSFAYGYLKKGISEWGTNFRIIVTGFEYEGVPLFSIPKGELEGNTTELMNRKVFIRKIADGVSVSFKR